LPDGFIQKATFGQKNKTKEQKNQQKEQKSTSGRALSLLRNLLHMKNNKTMKALLFAALLTGASASFAQTTKTSTGSGAWTTASRWTPSGVPASGDNVVIAAGHTVTTTGLTRTGAVTVNGTLSITNANFTAGSLSGSGTLTVTGVTGTTIRTLAFGSLNSNTTFSGTITGKAKLRKTGTGTLTLNGSGRNTYTGNTEIQGGGKIKLGSANRIPNSSSVEMCGNSTLDLNGFNDTIAGLGSTSGGCGNTFDHVVTNSSATMVTLTLQLLDGGYNGYEGGITGKLNLVVSGGGNDAQQDLGGASTYTGTTRISGGIVNTMGANAFPSTTDITITTPGQLFLSYWATCNKLTLGTTAQAPKSYGSSSSPSDVNNNTYFGGESVLVVSTGPGTFKTSTKTGLWNDRSVWSPSGVPATGDHVVIAAGHTVTTPTSSTGGAINRTGAITVNGTLSIPNTNFTAGSLSGSGTVAVTGASAINRRTLTFGGSNGNFTYSGIFTGNANVRKVGTNAFTLVGSGTNTYTGNTLVEGGGTLRLGADDRIPDGSSLRLCGTSTFDLFGCDETVADLTTYTGTCGSSTANIVTSSSAGNATLTITLLDGGYGSLSGSITGNLNLVVTGGGNSAQQDLDGANTYTGSTEVSGGILHIAATNAIPSATDIIITSPGQLSMGANATSSTLTFGTTAQNSGTYGSTASTATTKNDTYFDVYGTSRLTVTSSEPFGGNSSNTGFDQELPGSLDVQVFGNPSTSMFTLKIQSNNSDEKVSLKIADLTGRIVETKHNISAGEMVEFGMGYKVGSYFVEAIQGEQRKVIRLVKQ
jgi:fibronectin-binding autotransporter adhesin